MSSIEKTYSLQARYYPAVLTVIPALFLLNVTREYMLVLPEGLLIFLPYLIQVGLSGAAFCFQIQLNRLLSKEIFQKRVFNGELNRPTTVQLLWSNDTIDNHMKLMLHNKIKSFFDISLFSKEAESNDTYSAKRIIIVAVSQIQNSLRDNTQQVQHNREYGFWRNLAGGSLIAAFCSLIIIVLGIICNNCQIIIVGITMLCVYGLIIGFSPYLIRKTGQYYAKSLFEQFLSLKEKVYRNDE